MKKWQSPIVNMDSDKISESFGIDEERAEFLQFKMNKLLHDKEKLNINKNSELFKYIEGMRLTHQEGMYCFMIISMLVATGMARKEIVEEIEEKVLGGIEKIDSIRKSLADVDDLESKIKAFKSQKDDSVVN